MALIAEWGFNEGAGTTTADTSGGGHTLTRTSGATGWTTPGHAGSAAAAVASWSGAAGTVSDPNFMSVMFWVKINAAPTQYAEVIHSEDLSVQVWSDLTVHCSMTRPPPESDTAYSMRTTATVPLGQWTHVTFTCDATTGQGVIYLNGTTSASKSGFPSNATASFEKVDVLLGDYQPALNCAVDDLRLFDSSILASDVPTWMNTPLGPTSTATGTFAWTGAATGSAPADGSHNGQAAGAWTFTGAATGSAPAVPAHNAQASGAVAWSGGSTAQASHSAAVAGSWTWTGTAVASAPAVGSHDAQASGSFGWAGQASAGTPHDAGAAGTFTFTGAATGSAPTVGDHNAQASGAWTFTGAAGASTPHAAAAAGTFVWSGAATGHTPAATRDIRLLAASVPSTGWATNGPAAGWQTTAPGTSEWPVTVPTTGWTIAVPAHGEPITPAPPTVEPWPATIPSSDWATTAPAH